MIISNEKYNKPIIINTNQPTLIILNDLNELYHFQKEMVGQINGEDGGFMIFDGEKPLKIESQVEYTYNILMLTLNNRKAINYLYKQITTEVGKTDSLLRYEELKKSIIEFLSLLKKETLMDFSFNEDLDLTDILKVFDVKFSEHEDTPIQLLIRYIDLILTLTKTKVFFISFALYLFNETEVNELIQYAAQHDIYLIFVEKEVPKNTFDSNVITIVDSYIL
ncbi:MAG: type II-A CRISPR-associated protein Csn2 [Acholeplasmataceae bacterium]|nr:type II-A CRISPR-associated protein Csn2 [Acholeplasmataceae bacterium]